MFCETLLSHSLGMLIGLVQLKQPGRNHDEVDSNKRREESSPGTMFEVVPERQRCNGEKNGCAPRSQPYATRISFEPLGFRLVNDDQQWRVGTSSRIEDLEPNV